MKRKILIVLGCLGIYVFGMFSANYLFPWLYSSSKVEDLQNANVVLQELSMDKAQEAWVYEGKFLSSDYQKDLLYSMCKLNEESRFQIDKYGEVFLKEWANKNPSPVEKWMNSISSPIK